MAKNNPLPPADFKIKTKEELQAEKDAEFTKNNPKLALWMQIKGALTAADGDQYFTNTLKDSAVPQLRGVVVEGKPECRSKELLVAVPGPGQTAPTTAEIALKLDTALSGKPEVGSEVLFEGVPTAFTKHSLPAHHGCGKGQGGSEDIALCGGSSAHQKEIAE